VFTIIPSKSSDEAKELCYELAKKSFKVLTYIIIMVSVMTLLVLSKGSMLVAVSNVMPHLRDDPVLPTMDNYTMPTDASLLETGNWSTITGAVTVWEIELYTNNSISSTVANHSRSKENSLTSTTEKPKEYHIGSDMQCVT